MLKIRALNRESLSDEDGPTIRREAQEEIMLDMYNKALRLQSCAEYLAAEDILQTLLTENIPQLESQGGLPKTMSTIKYSCYINLGTIAINQKDFSAALQNYFTASELDSSDVTLWYKIGRIALRLDKFRQASEAFAKGLECSETHRPCLDNIISVLFALRDTVACLMYIGKALYIDPDYTKGLVLRKNIYESNPATKEYYQLYNPDYIYEPSLDVQIDKEDEEKILEEVQKLCDRVNDVEKSLAPKELPCIALPKPLEEFSWVSVGETLIELHKYISDNGLSHFCQVDLKKCMSQNGEVTKVDVPEPMEITPAIVEQIQDETENKSDDIVNDNENENMDAVAAGCEITERRLSQISDANTGNPTDVENNTPVQTDNDEMDQDMDETEENMEQKNEKSQKSQNRGTKRRRDLVSDLQIWGWHSKRRYSKKGKGERDFTIEDALKRIIPSYLLPNGIDGTKYNPFDDSMNTIDIYMKHIDVESADSMSPPSPKKLDPDPYFGSEAEKDDVLKFWTQKWNCCDAVNLIEGYVYAISKLWGFRWPKELIPIYVEAYNMFREHIEHPRFHCSETTFEDFRNDALATLVYGELTTYNGIGGTNFLKIHYASLYFLETVATWEEQWGDDYQSYWCRVNWLKAHTYRKDNQNILAINSLQLIQDVITAMATGNKLRIHLPNCVKYGYIIEQVTLKLLKNLEMIDSLSQLEKLYDTQKYSEVAEILKLTFPMSNPPTYGRMGRPAQLGMLLHSLWYTDLADCFVWTEECLKESVKHFLRPTSEVDKWEMILNKCILIMIEIIKKETISVVDSLTVEKRARLVESLALVCCRQINTENVAKIPLGTVSPWILLHYVLVREEHRLQAKKVVRRVKKDEEKSRTDGSENPDLEEEVPASIAVLFSGHEFLGGKSWCLTDQGELLHFILDTVIDRLDTPIFESLREKIDIHLEQAFFCLYQHPSKKNKVSRHLADHNVNPLQLTWDKAQQVYEFFSPDVLPEFDSYKSISISAELEQLLQRISCLVPQECNPQHLVPKVTEFVNGTSETLPEPINFPLKTRSMYYLLGDFFFKQSELKRSYKYFIMDLCVNPLRVDTWACLALGIASELESKLAHCERFKSEMEFLDRARSAQVCFQRALSLANDHITLWIEYGSFEYMVHSYCSRVLKYESEMLSMEKFDILENKKETFLNSSGASFLKALQLHQPDLCEIDERWLYHYMLGKIAEKCQKEPADYLQNYLTAAALLDENKATYPEKINYTNPQRLSIEALEINYRINASILKYMELHEGKPIAEMLGKVFMQCLETSVFPKPGDRPEMDKEPVPNKAIQRQTSTVTPMECESRLEKAENKECVSSVVKKCVDDLLTEVENGDNSVKDVKKETGDVIVLDDSDEDMGSEKEQEKLTTERKGKDVQDIMDEMMKETMEKQQENTNDDSDIVVQEVTISPENSSRHSNPKSNKNEQKEVSKGSSSERSEENNIRKSTEESSSSSSSSSDTESSDSDSDDSSSSSSSSSSENNGNLSESEIIALIDRCIQGLEECIRRLPQNYKALYRLAHLYFHYNKKKDLTRCRQLFLGEYKCKNGVPVTGLFSDRKANNFFNGIWRIPSSEIDRPGSLAAHMGRCVTLLLQILHDTNDHKTLLDMCLQLRKVPDADKIYIRHSEREQLSEQAITLCIQCLRKQIKNLDNMSSTATHKILLDVFRMYQRSQKNLTHKEAVFSGMLTDVYKKFMQDKIPENANVLDLAVKFCQQSKAADKLKKQQTQAFVPRAATLAPTSVPVLPTPSTIAPPINPPLKRPGVGRPRGRPPGPKIPGQAKAPRARNQQWNKGFDAAAFGYLKQYQDELLRQYSQTLSITQQMNQLGSLFPQTSQNNLLNSMNLMQTMQQLSTGMNPLMMSQLSQNLAQYQPNKMADMYKMPNTPSSGISQNLTPEQVRLLTAMMPSTSTSLMSSATTATTSTVSSKSAFGMPKASTSKTATKSIPTFKYPTEPTKVKVKDVTKTTSSFAAQKTAKMIPKDLEKAAAASILKDRPNISITPVTQATATVTMAKQVQPPVTPPKTLQEKLADKQKQRKIEASGNKEKSSFSANKVLDLGAKSSSLKSVPIIPNITLPSSINVYPTFPKDSGVCIGQVPPVPKAPKSSGISISAVRSESVISKPKHVATSSAEAPKLPASLSVRKIEELRDRKHSSDDDVIIIE